jgi:type IV secretion system protein VirD4
MRNYAGHRLAPWLAHVMVSRQETARPLLTPGEVMQLPPGDELVLISGLPPIRAKKLRYYEDVNFERRVSAAPELGAGGYSDCPAPREDDWSGRTAGAIDGAALAASGEAAHGALQKERAPALPARRSMKRTPSEQLELRGIGDDEVDPAADARVMAAARPLSPVVAAHAVNEGSARGDDLMPSF